MNELEEAQAFLKEAKKQIMTMMRKNEAILKEIDATVTSHDKILKKVAYANECVEEMLCSVLVAIRQHEYLQPWKPKDAPESKPEL
jgi:nitrogen fixation/metabolism regulation signal transduction histidine kinase